MHVRKHGDDDLALPNQTSHDSEYLNYCKSFTSAEINVGKSCYRFSRIDCWINDCLWVTDFY